jgi:hypothetical protein
LDLREPVWYSLATHGCHRREREDFLIQHVGGCTLSCR